MFMKCKSLSTQLQSENISTGDNITSISILKKDIRIADRHVEEAVLACHDGQEPISNTSTSQAQQQQQGQRLSPYRSETQTRLFPMSWPYIEDDADRVFDQANLTGKAKA